MLILFDLLTGRERLLNVTTCKVLNIDSIDIFTPLLSLYVDGLLDCLPSLCLLGLRLGVIMAHFSLLPFL